MKVQVILGSTRPNRAGESVAKWVVDVAQKRDDAEYELVDIAEYNLPPFDEPMPPAMGQYTKEHTKKWSAKISEADAYIFVTPEYNHSFPGTFKNAIDYLYNEWNNKSVGFVSYGGAGGTRAVEHWRNVVAELQMADVRNALHLYLAKDFENYSKLNPTPEHEQQLNKVLDQVVAWGKALKTLRSEQ